MADNNAQIAAFKSAKEYQAWLEVNYRDISLESDKDAVALIKLQAQWLLFGCLAASTFVLSKLGNESFDITPTALVFILTCFGFGAASAWVAIQFLISYYFEKSTAYSGVFIGGLAHIKATLYEPDTVNVEPKPVSDFKLDMDKSTKRRTVSIACINIALFLFLIGAYTGLNSLSNSLGEMNSEVNIPTETDDTLGIDTHIQKIDDSEKTSNTPDAIEKSEPESSDDG